MAEVIKKIRTPNGDLPIDYNALANKPDLDKKLNTSGGTVTGDLTIEGDLRVQGNAVETHLENVKIPQNSLTLRDGASQGLLDNEYTGIVAEKYDGANDGMLVFDKGGTAYVGDEGDLQPLATRGNVTNNNLVKWDQQNLTLVDAGESVDSIGQKIDAKAHLSHTTKQENIGYSIDVPSDSANYAEVTKVGGMTRKCTNLLGGIALANRIKEVNVNAIIDTANKTVFYYAGGMENKIIFNTFKPNTQYTFFIKGSGSARYPNLTIKYTDGTETAFQFSAANTDETLVRVSDATKSVESLVGSWYDGSSTLYYDECGIFEGVLSVNEFESYFEGLRSAKVTEIKSVGVNLLSEQRLIAATNASDEGDYIKFRNQLATISNTLFKPKTVYILSFVGKIDVGNGRLAIKYTDGTVDNAIINSTTDVLVTIHSNDEKTIASIDTSFGDSGNVWIKKGTLMLNEGVIALPYTPYVEHTLHIPEAMQALDGYCQGVNEKYFNSVVWDSETNKKWFKRRVKQKIFDGTENFVAWTNGSTFIGVTLDGMDYDYSYGQDIRGVCSHFKILIGGQIVESALCFRQGGDMARFYFVDSSLTSVADWKNFFATQYAEGNPVVLVYGMAKEEVIDISGFIATDNFIRVENNGTLTFENEYKYNVPSTVQFYENTNELISADEFIGDLTGTAKRAVADKEGRNIEQTYATKTEMNEKLAVSVKKTYSGIKHQEAIPSDVASYAAAQKIGGMSYKTKNLLKPFAVGSSNWNGYTITRNADGSTTITGAATGAKEMLIDIVDVINYPVYMSAGETYTLTVTKDGVPIEIGEKVDYKDAAGGTYWGWPGDTTRARALTKLYAQKTVSAGDNTTLNGVYKAILTKENTALPYEPYFEGLRSAKVTEVESVGVNLFGGNSTENPQYMGDYYCNSNGIISSNADYNCFVIPIVGGKTYFFWSFANSLPCAIIHFLDDNGLLGVNTALYGKPSGAIIALSGAKYMRFAISKDTTEDICINESNAAYNGKYYPYVKCTLPIPEAVQSLDGYGEGINESAYNYIDWEKKQFVKYTSKVVFDGSPDENWMMHQFSNLSAYIIPFPGERLKGGGVICDKFEVLPHITGQVDGTVGVAVEGVDLNNGGVFFGVKGLASSVEEWRNYLVNNPVTVVIALANPIVTDISDILPNEVIQVEDNGTLTFANEFSYDVPYEVNFYDEIDEIVAANEIVGDLIGTASMAQCDATGRNIATGYVKQEPVYYHQFKVQKYKNGNFVVDMWDLGTTISFNGLKCFVLNSAGERVYLSSIYTSTGSGTIYTPDGTAVPIYYDDYPDLNTIYFYDKEGAEAWSGTQYESSNVGNAITISYSRSVVDEMSVSVGETTVTETELKKLKSDGAGCEKIGEWATESGWMDMSEVTEYYDQYGCWYINAQHNNYGYYDFVSLLKKAKFVQVKARGEYGTCNSIFSVGTFENGGYHSSDTASYPGYVIADITVFTTPDWYNNGEDTDIVLLSKKFVSLYNHSTGMDPFQFTFYR